MQQISSETLDLQYMDSLSAGDSPLHRLDARAKVAVTLLFILAVVSHGKYEVSALAPFALYPVYLIAAGGLPGAYLLRKTLLAAPFAFFVGVFNPLFDGETLLRLGPLAVSGGWVSFASIMLRFALTVPAALALLALTGVNPICAALARWGVPGPFVVQLLFLNRFLGVLAGEAERMSRARALRAAGRGAGPRALAQLAGQLLLRAFDRAERVHAAMLCRGFDGEVRVAFRGRFGRSEWLFVSGWGAYFAMARSFNLPLLLGQLLEGVLK